MVIFHFPPQQNARNEISRRNLHKLCLNKTSDLLPWKHSTYPTGPAKTINVWSLMIFMSIKGWEHVYPDGYYSETLPEKKRWWKRPWFPWPLLQCSSPKLGRPAVEAGILCAPLLYPHKVYWVLEHQGYGHMFCRSHWFHLPQCFNVFFCLKSLKASSSKMNVGKMNLWWNERKCY